MYNERYSKITDSLFGGELSHFNKSMFDNLIEDTRFDDLSSIKRFRNFITAYRVELSKPLHPNSVSIDTSHYIVDKLNFKIYDLFGIDFTDIYHKSKRVYDNEHGFGKIPYKYLDKIYEAFSYDVGLYSTVKPHYYIVHLKFALLWASNILPIFKDICDETIVDNLMSFELDNHIKDCFIGTLVDDTEVVADAKICDDWLDLLLTRDFVKAYGFIYDRIYQYREYIGSDDVLI